MSLDALFTVSALLVLALDFLTKRWVAASFTWGRACPWRRGWP